MVLSRYDEGTICTVSGWGTTTEGGSLARVLQKVNMIMVVIMVMVIMVVIMVIVLVIVMLMNAKMTMI